MLHGHFDPAAFPGGDGDNLTTRGERDFIGTFDLVLAVGLEVLANSPAGARSFTAVLMDAIKGDQSWLDSPLPVMRGPRSSRSSGSSAGV